MSKYKNAEEIVALLVRQNKPLSKCFLCSQVKELFAKKGLIHKVYLNKQIIRIQATSNITYTELKHEHTITSLKALLKQFKKFKKLGDEWEIKDIKVFYDPSLGLRPVKKQPLKKNSYFFEPSLGEFENLLSDQKLHDDFEKIRKQILKNRTS